MRNAISYCAMRVSVSGSPSVSACRWFSACTPSSMRAAGRAVDAGGVAQIEHRIAGAAHGDPGVPAGRKPLLHIRADSAWTFDLLV